MNKLIGVYGTLRKGERNHKVLRDSKFIKTIRLEGYKMYGISGFPAIIKGELIDSIVIEIYRIIDDTIAMELDLLERFDRNYPASSENHYIVQLVKIESEKEPIEIYTYDHAPENVKERGPQLRSGDWVKRSKET